MLKSHKNLERFCTQMCSQLSSWSYFTVKKQKPGNDKEGVTERSRWQRWHWTWTGGLIFKEWILALHLFTGKEFSFACFQLKCLEWVCAIFILFFFNNFFFKYRGQSYHPRVLSSSVWNRHLFIRRYKFCVRGQEENSKWYCYSVIIS